MPLLKYFPASFVLAPVPAYAAGGIVLPEPSSLVLLGLGVVGVAVGRKLSTKRRED